jgi:hypothetical protein
MEMPCGCCPRHLVQQKVVWCGDICGSCARENKTAGHQANNSATHNLKWPQKQLASVSTESEESVVDFSPTTAHSHTISLSTHK